MNHFDEFVKFLNQHREVLSQDFRDALIRRVNGAMQDAFERGKVEGSGGQQITASGLTVAWKKYKKLFGVPPHGTQKQLAAMMELVPKGK